jgi:hypothetical protein
MARTLGRNVTPTVTGRFKTSHSWALQNQPRLFGVNGFHFYFEPWAESFIPRSIPPSRPAVRWSTRNTHIRMKFMEIWRQRQIH